MGASGVEVDRHAPAVLVGAAHQELGVDIAGVSSDGRLHQPRPLFEIPLHTCAEEIGTAQGVGGGRLVHLVQALEPGDGFRVVGRVVVRQSPHADVQACVLRTVPESLRPKAFGPLKVASGDFQCGRQGSSRLGIPSGDQNLQSRDGCRGIGLK